jgi:putative ABC transport system permease protein
VPSAVRHRRQIIVRGSALLAAALGLGLSTAVFTTAHDQQSRLDVALTVGTDVSTTALPGTDSSPAQARIIDGAPPVAAVKPLVRRFAFVGPDLQDLFGIHPPGLFRVLWPSRTHSFWDRQFIRRWRPWPPPGTQYSCRTSRSATTIRMSGTKSGCVCLSDLPTTCRSPSTSSGSSANLRLHPRTVSSWPTPTLWARWTGHSVPSLYLVASSDPVRTAAYLQATLGRGWNVQDITSARSSVVSVSGLAATDHHALAHLVLRFAIAFACSGPALGIGIAERRRSLTVLAAVGTPSRQRSRFLVADGGTMIVRGALSGLAIGVPVGHLLVAMLRGTFDRAPDGLAEPQIFVGSLTEP